VRLAADRGEPVVLLVERRAGTLFRVVRRRVEHVQHARALPWLPASVAVDLVPALRRMVAAR